jgi:hypothetical protein
MFGPKLPLSKIDYDFYYSTDKQGDIDFSTLDLGAVNISSGQIVVCDPLLCLGSFCDSKTQSLHVKFEQVFLGNKKGANMYDDFLRPSLGRALLKKMIQTTSGTG